MKQIRGFTIIEVTVTIAIFATIAYGLLALVSNMLSFSSGQSNVLVGIDQARKVAFGITSELRTASIGANGGYSIAQADSQQLIFYSNIDTTSDIEKVRYFVQNNKLNKGVTKPAGSTYNPPSEQTSVAVTDLANGSNPVFYYYDGTPDGTTDNYLIQPVSIPQIKFIKIKLDVYKKGGVVNQSVYTVINGATIRNLKTNLGN
ncbi:MAG: hypothetical protein UY65_C0001G0003 [Parcubacteria group bacterium GW2011_GWA2_51_12]|nr:MAG: hypothetical protein UY65_C0001G0003 [Parcubacteria group bacterium GW2011_GWA2_51_12]